MSTKRLQELGENLEENEEEIDDQTRSMDSHEIQCEKEYGSDPRADTGTLFFPEKIVMEKHSMTPSPNQSWSTETKSPGFEEPVGDSINNQNSKPTVNPGRRSTEMELANESKFSGEQTTFATSSLNTMGAKKKVQECR